MTTLTWLVVALAASANTCAKAFPDSRAALGVSFCLNASSFLVLRHVLRTQGMGQVQVVVSSGMILSTMCIGMLLFGETLTPQRIVATILALLAILLTNHNTPIVETSLVSSTDWNTITIQEDTVSHT